MNPARNEAEVPFKGKNHQAKLTFDFIYRVESQVLRRPLLRVFQDIIEGNLPFSEAAALGATALQYAPGAPRNVTAVQFGDDFQRNSEGGAPALLALASTIIARALALPVGDAAEDREDDPLGSGQNRTS